MSMSPTARPPAPRGVVAGLEAIWRGRRGGAAVQAEEAGERESAASPPSLTFVLCMGGGVDLPENGGKDGPRGRGSRESDWNEASEGDEEDATSAVGAAERGTSGRLMGSGPSAASRGGLEVGGRACARSRNAAKAT
eukprot:scaffold86937_cov31-Tisochrysis_lutea.AAC.2